MTVPATTIRYSFPADCKFRLMSFPTYQKAIEAIEMFRKVNIKAELKHW